MAKNRTMSAAFCARMLLDLQQKHNSHRIVVTSSIRDSQRQEQILRGLAVVLGEQGKRVEVTKSFEKLPEGTDFTLCLAPCAQEDFSAFETCRSGDITICLERLGKTRHKAFEALMDYLREGGILVGGVITY